jgi:hypothetical protein
MTNETATNPRRLVIVNLVLGAIASISNGGAAGMMLGNPRDWSFVQIGEAVLLAAVGLSILLAGVLAIVGRISLLSGLKWQAAALTTLLALLVAWGATIVLTSDGHEMRLSWMVGILSALAVYSFYVLRRALSAHRFERLRPILIALCSSAIIVDIAVFVRVGWF